MSESVLLFLLFRCKYSSVEATVPSTQWVLLRWVSWMFFYGLDGWNKVHGDQKHFRDTIMKENRSYSLILALLWLVHEDELSVMPIRTSWVMNVSRSLYLLVFIQRRLMTISVGSKHLCQIKCAAQSRCFIWQVTPSLNLTHTFTQTTSSFQAPVAWWAVSSECWGLFSNLAAIVASVAPLVLNSQQRFHACCQLNIIIIYFILQNRQLVGK